MPVLNSEAIYRVEYDGNSSRMTIWFRSGQDGYDFCGVPTHIYEGLLAASSAGTFYHQHIRDRYQC